jgi:hypothetical protein
MWPLLVHGCARDPSDIDRDGDGYAASVDCDDRDPDRHPGADDPPEDGADRDCDGVDGGSEWLGEAEPRVAFDEAYVHQGSTLAAHGAQVAVGCQWDLPEFGGGLGRVVLVEGPRLTEQRRWEGKDSIEMLGMGVSFGGAGSLVVSGGTRRYVVSPETPSGVLADTGAASFQSGEELELGTAASVLADLQGTGTEQLVLPGYLPGESQVRLVAEPTTGEYGPDDTVILGLDAYSVAVGDVDGDNAPDLATGLLYADDGAGRVWIATGPFPAGVVGPEVVVRTWVGGSDDAGLGYALVLADTDGDGIDEVVVSAVAGRRGRVYVLDADARALSDARFVVEGDEGIHHLGWSMAVADFDQDGVADLAVGSPSVPALDATLPGRVLVFFGPLEGQRTAADADRSFAGEAPGDAAGAGLAAADLNGDGAPDLVIGAPHHDGGGEDAGAIYAVLGPLSR